MKVPAKASILFQRSGPKMQNATKRLYYSKEVDQTIFLGHFFTQERRPIGRHLPHLRSRFVGINRYAIVMFAAYAARKICRATPHWNEAEAIAEMQKSLLNQTQNWAKQTIASSTILGAFFASNRTRNGKMFGQVCGIFCEENSHTHSNILKKQSATLQKILTQDEAKNDSVAW